MLAPLFCAFAASAGSDDRQLPKHHISPQYHTHLDATLRFLGAERRNQAIENALEIQLHQSKYCAIFGLPKA
jgi:hypothetical protein